MGLSIQYVCAFCIGIVLACLITIRMLIASLIHGKKVLAGPTFRSRPKILSDPKYGKSGYLHLKKVTLHYVESGSRSKPLLLLLHGFPEFWFSWRHQLADKDLTSRFHVVAIDMRGYADSDKPTAVDDYKTEALAEDIKEVVAALGHTSCYLAGHDWGGVVSWEVAMRHPQTVRRLIILNAPHPFAFFRGLRSNRKQLLNSWYMFLFQVPAFAEWFMTRNFGAALAACKSQTPEEKEAYKYTLGSPESLRGPVNYYRAAFRNIGNSQAAAAAAAGKLQMPVLFIFGAKDRYILQVTARQSADFCESFRFELVPDATHWVQQDQPHQVARLIQDFILEEPQNELEEAGRKLESLQKKVAGAAKGAVAGAVAGASMAHAAAEKQQQQQQQEEEEAAEDEETQEAGDGEERAGGLGVGVSVGGVSAAASFSG